MSLILRNIIQLQKPHKNKEKETETPSPYFFNKKLLIVSTFKILTFSTIFFIVGFLYGLKLHPYTTKTISVPYIPDEVATEAKLYNAFIKLYNNLSPENKEKINKIMITGQN